MSHCPACDVQHSDDPLFCLALGVAAGHAHQDIHDVTESMCRNHRMPYVMAMARVAAFCKTEAPCMSATSATNEKGTDR